MEFGSPPLYAEANRVARDMDLTFLKELGPFLKALSEITYYSEDYKKKNDKETTGKELGGDLCGSFLLWRGAPMKEQWIQPYQQVIGRHV